MRLIVPLLVVLALSVPASAQECVPTTSEPEISLCTSPVELGIVGSCDYFDNDPCQPGCVFSIWWYGETNGIPGLQRGDEVKDDTCGGQIASDTIPG